MLKNGLEQLEIDYSIDQLEALKLYVREIEMWNRKYKLVSAEGDQLIIRHILDSLSAVPVLMEYSFNTAADIGSGAGLPGIPLALFFPDVRFTLVERSGRRAGFLRNAVSLLNLSDRVEVLECGVEDVTGTFDVVLFRAFRNLAEYYNVLINIRTDGGLLFAYKGKLENVKQEISDLKVAVKTEIIEVKVPYLNEERNFCIFKS